MGVFIIAEAGVNHNGDIDLAKKLCLAAKEAGADAVKFQTWQTDKIITQKVAQADYQIKNTGYNESQYDMLKRLELSYDEFREIKRYCDDIKIQFCSTADEYDSLDFLVSLGIPFIKVGSGEIGNVSYLRKIGSKAMPVILSTGMSTLGDIEQSLDALRIGGAQNITLLHCTTNYPCAYENVNLLAIDTLKNAFHLPVGYSDHTVGTEVAVAAVARGVAVIEKHFTLDKNMEGPDHLASTEPEEFKRMVEEIRHIEKALGDGIKRPGIRETKIAEVVLKRIVAKRRINCGKIITADDICVKRNNCGLSAKYWDLILGMTAKKDYLPDDAIEL